MFSKRQPSQQSADASTSQRAQLRSLMEGFERSQLIYVAAELGLADLIADGALDARSLSEATGLEEVNLYRLLRGLAWCGVARHEDDDSFTLTELGQGLRVSAEGSLHERALCIGEIEFPAWATFLKAARTGKPTFEAVFGRGLYDHLAYQPRLGACFDSMMSRSAHRAAAAVLEAYDFSSVGTLLDVGGGNGTLIATVLEAYPETSGVLFDRPRVIERATEVPRLMALGERLAAVAGDFFAEIPGSADLWVLKWILHNWDDESCLRLLGNCRRAMNGHGKLLIVELLMPERVDSSSDAVSLDLGMLVHLGGGERTVEQFRNLLAGAGFDLERIIPTGSEWSLLEAAPRRT